MLTCLGFVFMQKSVIISSWQEKNEYEVLWQKYSYYVSNKIYSWRLRAKKKNMNRVRANDEVIYSTTKKSGGFEKAS